MLWISLMKDKKRWINILNGWNWWLTKLDCQSGSALTGIMYYQHVITHDQLAGTPQKWVGGTQQPTVGGIRHELLMCGTVSKSEMKSCTSLEKKTIQFVAPVIWGVMGDLRMKPSHQHEADSILQHRAAVCAAQGGLLTDRKACIIKWIVLDCIKLKLFNTVTCVCHKNPWNVSC